MRLRLLVVILLIGAVSGCAASAIQLRVHNESGKTITNMKLSYAGGAVAVDRIKIGKTYRVPIAPTEVTPLEIEFQMDGGEPKKSTIRGALEPNMAGEVVLTIIEDGGVGWEVHLSPGKKSSPRGTLTPH
jgi:hypothetical protein